MAAIKISMTMERPAGYRSTGRKTIRCSLDIAQACPVGEFDREAFFVIMLDQRHAVLGIEMVSMGSLTASLVHPREVYRPAILAQAAAVAFVHNHPSGDTTPSTEDKRLTDRLKQAGEILGIRVIDHVIVGANGHHSFADCGQL
jgi:DNA repair protein RadC